MRRSLVAAIVAAALLAACTSARESAPARTATEQLLLSSAVDRAAQALMLDLPPDAAVYVDASLFEGLDGKYAVGSVREQLLRRGARLMPDRDRADIVVEIRSGALSIDDEKALLGIPAFDVPVPLSDTISTPELALVKRDERRGTVKLAAIAYDAHDGRMVDATGPRYGFSHITDWTVLVFSWSNSDVLPEDKAIPPITSTLRDFGLGTGP
ncbi:hypothetical protein GCM10011505_26750 [Tistrella bauzanensis]|uniref:Uncharacterized protein n=1 Tax=Tistrella bauzanensis TaxID=657419 RepID=A0ABQ1IKF5_9PROT|nr:DUF6655 family protein [Tistrella bauzanensis]GGB44068.1 hypothetical protein GCM10011505_26750 [Tistrella bauzanensis]